MRRVMVRYKVKPEQADENIRRVQAVFAQLEREQPAGLRYMTFRLPDGVSFVHVASVEVAENPLTALEAFKQFAGTIKDRCVEPPVTTELEVVGSYRFLDG
jgi:hypothetical protein